MKALTLWPEWAWAVCTLMKDVENRRWDPTRRGLRLGDRFAIHAGKTIGGRPGCRTDAVEDLCIMARRADWRTRTSEGRLLDWDFDGVVQAGGARAHVTNEFRFDDVPRSAVVAVATLAGVTRESGSPWAVPGEFHWQLGDVVVLSTPVPCRGRQLLWELPASVGIAVDQQINAITIEGEEAF